MSEEQETQVEEVVKPKYLGQQEIEITGVEGDVIHISFVNGEPITLHKELYDIMVSDEIVPSPNIEELVWATIANKFFNDLVKWNLKAYEVRGVTQYLQNRSQNLHKEATKKLWGGKDEVNVELQDIAAVLKVDA